MNSSHIKETKYCLYKVWKSKKVKIIVTVYTTTLQIKIKQQLLLKENQREETKNEFKMPPTIYKLAT